MIMLLCTVHVCVHFVRCCVHDIDNDRGCVFFIDRYRATVYPCPEKLEERRDMLANLGARIADLQIVSISFLTVKQHPGTHR